MSVTLRFYAELRDFLPEGVVSGTIVRRFDVGGSVKDVIEGCGVPHTEVDLVLANGESASFSYQVADGDRISVFPVFEAFDVTPVQRVRPEPLRTPRFLADVHLGRLARYLRLLGLDTTYDREWSDHELVQLSLREGRTLLTRDVGLLKHGSLTHGYFVRHTAPRRQVVEVARRFQLEGLLAPFTRCMACNGELEEEAEARVADRVPARSLARHDRFLACGDCARVYWPGAHQPGLLQIVEAVRTGTDGSDQPVSAGGIH